MRNAFDRSGLVVLTLVLTLPGCVVGPDYHRPAAPMTPRFREADGWRPGRPTDAIDKGAWWSMFDDSVLDSLEQRVAASNQTVKQYEAVYRQAHAIVAEANASFFPAVGGSLQVQRSHSGAGSASSASGVTESSGASSTASGLLEATWIPDLWGRVRRTVESDKALAQASAADLANARLSAQSLLAEDYFELRVLDEQARLYRDTVSDYARYVSLTKVQYTEGTQSLSAVVSARTQWLDAQSSLIAIAATRDKMEHAIAVLTGAPPATLRIAPAPFSRNIPVAPAGVPSSLLERRPDIAAAERRVAAANAQIGVAISAYFPNVTLAADAGGQAGGLAGLSSSPTSLWSLGADVSESLIDFGARHAQVSAARASYDENVASYRQTVLTAFQGVEDDLSALRVYQQQEGVVLQAEAEAHRAVQLDLAEYREGTVDYTTVLTAQAASLNASQSVLNVLRQRLQACVLLVEDLGGGWSTEELPKG